VHNHESARQQLPSAAVAQEYPAAPSHPHSFYRWSALAQLLPYMENENLHSLLDLTLPLYMPQAGYPIAARNKPGVAVVVPGFLCPSDVGEVLKPGLGPTNYAFCTGSGAGGGTPFETDGAFYVNSATRFADITDGASNTIFASESLLGQGTVRDANSECSGTTPQLNYKFVLAFFGGTELTDFKCTGTQNFNSATGNGNDPRGFAWCSGEYRTASYNHYYLPNAVEYDCITSATSDPTPPPSKPILYSAWGWRAARSAHVGGVNTLWGDGSLRFVEQGIDPAAWRSFSTRAAEDAE
jgi:hypothetical protein